MPKPPSLLIPRNSSPNYNQPSDDSNQPPSIKRISLIKPRGKKFGKNVQTSPNLPEFHVKTLLNVSPSIFAPIVVPEDIVSEMLRETKCVRENGEFLAILRNERVSGIQKPIIRRSSDQRDLCNETVIQGKRSVRQCLRKLRGRLATGFMRLH